jgi:hypothetical protein
VNGEHDRFLPPHRLAPALRRTMNLDVQVFPCIGHLTTPDHLDEVVFLSRGSDISWLHAIYLCPMFTLLLAVAAAGCVTVLVARHDADGLAPGGLRHR